MGEAFVIMQIGNTQLDKLWQEVYCPVIKECGLDPKRVDKHNEGRILQSEIADFIRRAKIIIADLTHERQNCYLEVGYAMGIGKVKNLILCAREDHHHDSPNYKKDGSKIHFDLSGYSFLWWHEPKLEEFKKELSSRIKQRLSITEKENNNQAGLLSTDIWVEKERQIAISGLKKLNLGAYYEIFFQLFKPPSEKTATELLKIAEAAAIDTSWPIGVVLHNDLKPKPHPDGIRCTIETPDKFDYWTLKKDGRFYFLRSLEEDSSWERNNPGKDIHIDARIRRITETIMYCSQLYKGFGINEHERVAISIIHSGLLGRIIAVADPDRHIMDHWKTETNEVISSNVETIGNLILNIKEIVFKIVSELSVMFDYFDLKKSVCDDIVEKFMSRKY